MKQTLEEAVNEIGGVHPDWDKITCFRIGFKEGARWQTKQPPWVSVKERLPADRKEIYMSCDFKDFSPRKGFLCKEYFKIL